MDNNGYVRNVDLAAIATSGSWNDLLGIPADIADGDANTQLTEAEVDAFVDNNGYIRNVDLSDVAAHRVAGMT